MLWRLTPPLRRLVYAGTFGGVFKSTNGGGNWTAINSGLTNANVGTLAIDPVTPTTLYTGTDGGVFKSTNGGSNWVAIISGLGGVVSVLAIDPTSPTILYAGTVANGVFKSTNAGGTWVAINKGFPSNIQIRALAIDPATTATLYAGTDANVFKSTNAGGTWVAINNGLPGNFQAEALTIDPASPATLYVGTNGSVFKSTNGGTSWFITGLTSALVSALAIDAATPTTLYAGTLFGGVFKTVDGGSNWSSINSGLTNTDIGALAIDPTIPATLYAGTFGGAFKSTTGGVSWTTMNSGLANTIVDALAIDPVTPATVYAGTEINAVFKSIAGGSSWNTVDNGFPNETSVEALAIDPSTPTIIYAGSPGAGVFKSTNGAGNWIAVNNGLPAGFGSFVDALAIDPATPANVYAGTLAGVFKSTNGGGNWSPMNSGLTNTDVVALAIDPATPTILYTGTNGGVFKSTNGGASWSAMNSGLAGVAVSALAIDPITPTTLYAGNGGGVFKSTNGGASWSAINSGLPSTVVLALAVDPTTPTTLYAGAFASVFKSSDGGTSWNAMNIGLPGNTYVRALAINPAAPTTVYAGTNGGGTFVIHQVAAVTHILTVASTNPSSLVTISVTDSNGQSNGITPFTRSYNTGAPVTLNAPLTAGGNNFSNWTGCDSTSGAVCTLTLNTDRIVSANFVTSPATHTLTVVSTNPNSGAPITASPSDNNGKGTGTTQFTLTYNVGVSVTLAAQVSAGGNNFSNWTGCDSSSGVSCTMMMNANRTATANFVSLPPDSGNIDLLDPITALLSGNNIISDPSNPVFVNKSLLRRIGVAADGVAKLVIRFNAPSPGLASFSLVDQTGMNLLSNTDEAGSLTDLQGLPLNGSRSIATVSNQGEKAFAIYRAPTRFVRKVGQEWVAADLTASSRQVFLKVSFSAGGTSSFMPLLVVRPPVVLVHGLWSSERAWSNFPLVSSLGCEDSGHFYACRINYPLLNDAKFAVIAPNVGQRIRNVIAKFRTAKQVAALQADIVAHSMGGDIIRTLPECGTVFKDCSFQFAVPANLGAGDIHELVTIGTPHRGTPLAGRLIQFQGQCDGLAILTGTTLAQSFADKGHSITNGAIEDLQITSGAISGLNSVPLRFPVHFVVGVANTTDEALLDSNKGLVGSVNTCNSKIIPGSDIRKLFGSDSDLLVSIASQRNNLINGASGTTTSTSVGDYVIHTSTIVNAGQSGFSVDELSSTNIGKAVLLILDQGPFTH